MDLEANTEEIEAALETIGALEDWYWDRQLAIGCRWQPKKLTQGDGWSWQKLVVAQGWLTHLAIPAWCKGCSHKRLLIEKRWWKGPECNSGTRNWDIKEQLHLGSKRTSNKIIRQTLRLEAAKRAVGVFHQAAENLWLDTVEDSVCNQTEETTGSLCASAVGALATLRYSLPINRRNSDTPMDYLGRPALRRKQCGIYAQSKNCGARWIAFAR
jgi:hypothetical protein